MTARLPPLAPMLDSRGEERPEDSTARETVESLELRLKTGSKAFRATTYARLLQRVAWEMLRGGAESDLFEALLSQTLYAAKIFRTHAGTPREAGEAVNRADVARRSSIEELAKHARQFHSAPCGPNCPLAPLKPGAGN